MAAIGVILILKQIPHIVGHDADPEGEMSFWQPDRETTFSELGQLLGDLHPGAATVGLISLAILVLNEVCPPLKRRNIPAPLIVVIIGTGMQWYLQRVGGVWSIESSHLVQVPVPELWSELASFLRSPAFSQWTNPSVYLAAVTIAIVASLETLLNLEAIDKLDPKQRTSPPSRELIAQGIGNVVSGLVGGMPLDSPACLLELLTQLAVMGVYDLEGVGLRILRVDPESHAALIADGFRARTEVRRKGVDRDERERYLVNTRGI